MLLAIDAGNTNIVFAVYDGDETARPMAGGDRRPRAPPTNMPSGCSQLLALEGLAFADLDAAIIATVVPAVLFDLRQLCRKYLKTEPLVVGDPALDLGIKHQCRPAGNRWAPTVSCNAVAAHERYKGAVIVVDFGTATNFDIVAENGDFDGSVIAPGANLSVEALHQAAALLPRVAIHRAQNVIGSDTVAGHAVGRLLGLCRPDRRPDRRASRRSMASP